VLRPLRNALLILLGLVLAGLVSRPLERAAWADVSAGQPALRLESIKDALGEGITVGLLGGFRAIVADFFWLRTNSLWEDTDLPGTQTSIKIVTAIDPRPLYFWLNGSRMIAYDMPHWRIARAGGYETTPQAVQRRFDEEQARVAINYLQRAYGFHPEHPLVTLEIGNIYLNRLKDLETAAAYYLKASRHPEAPYYAARIYAELLRKLGRKKEAYTFLRELHPRLPVDDIFAQSAVVLERLRDLEAELEIPLSLRYQTVGAPSAPSDVPSDAPPIAADAATASGRSKTP
jgi:tetratricopeptide (TPR) repeat protein